jgi:hypothetical protein
MLQGQAALAFAEWGTLPERVPISLQTSIIPSAGSYHKPLYVKKFSFAEYAKVSQSVTVRYNLVVEPGLPVSPPSKAARLFSCLPPGPVPL